MDPAELAKADSIGFHFHTKLVHVVNHARVSTATGAASGVTSKVDKWFNLETPEALDVLSKELKDRYRHFSAQNVPLPLEIQVLLTIPDPTKSSRVLVHTSPSSSQDAQPRRSRIQPAPRSILLEKWTLEFQPGSHSTPVHGSTDDDFSTPTMYKHAICYFRSIFSLLHILPSWSTCKKLKAKRNGGGFGIRVHVPSSDTSASSVDFDTPLSASMPTPSKIILPRQTHTFPPFLHPSGALHLKVEYLEDGGSDFQLEDLESVLSDKLRREEEEDARFKWEAQVSGRDESTGWRGVTNEDVDFVPTLTKNQQRDSLLSSGGAGASARSPPIPISAIRERRVSGMGIMGPSSPPKQSSPLSGSPGIVRASSAAPTYGSSRPGSQGANTSAGGNGTSPLAARLRRESGPIASTASSPGPGLISASPGHRPSTIGDSSSSSFSSPVRRPPLTINPFKSNTVSQSVSSATATHFPSSSLSLGAGGVGSLGTSSSTTSIPVIPPRPTPPHSAQGVAFPSGVSSGSSPLNPSPSSRLPPTSSPRSIPSTSIGGTGLGAGGSPASRLSSSPPGPHRPFAPSSLSSVSSVPVGSGTGVESSPTQTRKRYSSSFGHRYSSSGGGGVAAGASTALGASGGSRGGSPIRGSPRPLPSPSLPPPSFTPPPTSSSGGGSGISAPIQRTTEEDDISSFVQDIERRRPLGAPPTATSTRSSSPFSSSPRLEYTQERSGTGEILHSPTEIDQKLKDMSSAFYKSLEGLGSSGKRRSRTASGLRPGGGEEGSGSNSNVGSGQGSSEIVGRLEYS